MINALKKYLFYCTLGLFIYMPFHIFISQWASTATGGLDAWKIAKDVFAAALVSVLVCTVLLTRKYTKLYVWLLGIAIGYLFLHLLLFATTNQPAETGLLGTTYNNRLIWYVLIGYSLGLLNPGKQIDRTFAKILIAVSTVVCLIAFAQWLLPKDVMTHFGYSIERGVKPNFFIDDKPDLPRVFSTLRDPNSLAAFLILPSTLIIIALKKYWNTPKRTLLLGLQGLHGLIILLTFSRSGWIGLFLAHGLVITYMFRERLLALLKRFIIPVTCIIAVIGFGAFALRDQYFVQNVILHSDENTQAADSNELHVDYIQKGLNGIADDPEGHGPGTAGIVSTKLPNGLLTENYFVQVGYEVGLAGLALFVIFLGLLLKNLWEYRRFNANKALLASFVGLVFMNMLLHTWSNEAVAASWFMVAGLALTPKVQEYEVAARRAKASPHRS